MVSQTQKSVGHNHFIPYLYGSFEDTLSWRAFYLEKESRYFTAPTDNPRHANLLVLCKTLVKEDYLRIRKILNHMESDPMIVAIGSSVFLNNDNLKENGHFEVDYMIPCSKASWKDIQSSADSIIAKRLSLLEGKSE